MRNRAAKVSMVATLLAVGIVVWASLASAPNSSAIPAFSRKYQTSCTTCHSNYPELNDFGEAFKKNGFKFPKDDETFVKEPPVLLGAKAQKEVFPGAVYPGEMPGSIPVAFRYSGNFTYNSRQPISLGFLPRTDLFVPNTFTIIGAGSFGPSLSFWVDNDISAGGSNAAAGLGDGYLKVNDLGHHIGLPKDTLNLRMGQFELDLPFTQARGINLTPYDVYGQASIAPVNPALCGPVGTPPAPPSCTTNNPFVFGIPQRGIEIGGYPNDGNFNWSLAFVNGSNNTPAMRNYKDVYVRISQRFNLERDPESRKEVQAAGPTGPRDHTSIRFGGFYYYGRNALNMDGTLFPGLPTVRDPFYRMGADFRFKMRQFELYGLAMYGHDKNLVPNALGTAFLSASPITFTGGFAQAQYWIHPWVIAIMRYDFVNSPTDFQQQTVPTRFDTRNRFSPGVQLLVRANIKVAFEYQHRWQQPFTGPLGTQFFRANGIVSGIDYVF
ncbi:MAG TPA: hypothetical protein VEU31_08600 [Candidatus Acidoferrales bacterium]|nr:hypothetical protein [Candidatus Acidoferrales bacterium]